MAGDYLVNVTHTAITQFDCIFIDEFIEFVVWWEAPIEEAEEFLSYLGDDVFAIWGVEPSDLSSSPFVFAGFFYFIIGGLMLSWALFLVVFSLLLSRFSFLS